VTEPTDTLVVDLNREGVRSLEVPDRIEVDRSFTVELRNHGESTHVHLNLDDDLASVARLNTGNHHVPGGSTRPVEVAVTAPEDGSYQPVSGRLKVVIGYGQETRYVDIVVDLSKREPVTVDPDLGSPSARSRGDGGTTGAPRRATGMGSDRLDLDGADGLLRALPAAVLVLVAVALGAGAVLVPGGPDLTFGVLAAVAVALAGGYLLAT
jgi:hypothetical protein